jgi:hypothetical protein
MTASNGTLSIRWAKVASIIETVAFGASCRSGPA